jgi:hypothetical protein
VIQAALLDDVLAQVARQAGPTLLDQELAIELRSAFPGVHFTVCGDDDIPPRLAAAAGNDFCQLYYVGGGEHCLALTTDAEAATGIVVAMRGDDE